MRTPPSDTSPYRLRCQYGIHYASHTTVMVNLSILPSTVTSSLATFGSVLHFPKARVKIKSNTLTPEKSYLNTFISAYTNQNNKPNPTQ